MTGTSSSSRGGGTVRPIRVLVVDDDATLAAGRQARLSRHPHVTVVGALSFTEVLARLRARPIPPARHPGPQRLELPSTGRAAPMKIDTLVLDAHDRTARGQDTLPGIEVTRAVRRLCPLTVEQAVRQRRVGEQVTICMVTQFYTELPALGWQLKEAGGDLFWDTQQAQDVDALVEALRYPEQQRRVRQTLGRHPDGVPEGTLLRLRDELLGGPLPWVADQYARTRDEQARGRLYRASRELRDRIPGVKVPRAKDVHRWTRQLLGPAPGSRPVWVPPDDEDPHTSAGNRSHPG